MHLILIKIIIISLLDILRASSRGRLKTAWEGIMCYYRLRNRTYSKSHEIIAQKVDASEVSSSQSMANSETVCPLPLRSTVTREFLNQLYLNQIN